jgi:hypothetical protein
MHTTVDITQVLKDTENALRDFVASVLQQQMGADWIVKSGVTPERIEKWKERQEVEARRQASGAIDERLLYYADFYDLRTILKCHWPKFSDALGELKTFEVWLSELEKLRDPDAHRRELLPHQKHLALGLEGEIRTRIVRYRSKLETRDDYYPRIESVRDNYGTIYVAGGRGMVAGPSLRPGDKLEFVVTARDPKDEALWYQFASMVSATTGARSLQSGWIREGSYTYVVGEADVRANFQIIVGVRSSRKFHAHDDLDDYTIFSYEVLPPNSLEF